MSATALQCVDSWVLREQVANHLTQIVKTRSIVLTGDMGHLSIDHMINTAFANIDAPRTYDFQDVDVHEQDALRSLLWSISDYMLPGQISAEDVRQAIAGEKWLDASDGSHGSNKCYDCGQTMGLKFKGPFVEVYCKNPCANNRAFSVEIDFPTGVVVFADWPDHFNDLEEAGVLVSNNSSVNYLKGQREATDNYARHQILHHSVGNTCPRWYFNDATNSIQIGSNGYNEDTDEEQVDDGFEAKGNFCTDLWWVTMVDEQHYNAMLEQAGVDPDTTTERASIVPGRYRFTCYGRTSDSNGVYARAERIGECSSAPLNTSATRQVLSVTEAAGHSRAQYPLINAGEDVDAMFGFLDQNLNVIGNGIHNYGDFLSYHSVNKGETAQGTPLQWNTNSVAQVADVYPNFQKEYSLVWHMPLKFFPTDWLEAAVWFYTACGKYFDNGGEGYHAAYPSLTNRNLDQDMLAAMEKHRLDGMTDAQFYAVVSKNWGASFNGDIVAFNTERWRQERERIGAFIAETVAHLNTEIAQRTP